MDHTQLNWIANFIWGIADDVLRDLYVRGKYRDAACRWRTGAVIESTVERRTGASEAFQQKRRHW